MTATDTFLLSLSVVFPIIVGILRWKHIMPRYAPLFLVFCLGLTVELLTRYALTSQGISYIPGNNIFILAESILIPLQFRTWGFMRRNKGGFYILIGLLASGWVTEYLLLGSIMHLYPFYRMSYSLLIVLLSINAINYIVINEERSLARHPLFMICCGFIIFFTYQLAYEGIYGIVTNLASIDTTALNSAFSLINALGNILYGIGFLLVARNRKMDDWLKHGS